ncbi:DUF3794 domain-containing protein [Oscillospiraceae bacterium OttesenSCG-928-G22]|nr:DUF3794 domain-containing protein [Oscillospiraceae bacterium OttesenSCG-928-G22]
MELELKKNAYGFYDILFDLEGSREETYDAIVPDACSDILRLIDTYGTVFVRGREVRDERLEVTGSVRAEVLYVPEEGRGLSRLEVNIPFSHSFEIEGARPSAEIIAGAEIRSIDTQTINPRKVLVRVSLSIYARVYEPRALELCSGVEDAAKNGVQVLPGEHTAMMPVAVKTKAFSITDELEIQVGKPALAEILKSNISLQAGETRMIGHKMVFKGTAMVKVLYRAAGEIPFENLFVYESEFPFSQILEMSEVEDEAECSVLLSLSEFHISERENEGGTRTLGIAFDAEAQAVAYASRRLQTVSDLYSTKYPTAIEVRPQNFTGLSEKVNRYQTMRESIETGMNVKSVVDFEVSFSQVALRREASELTIESSAIIKVVYYGEDDLCYSASRVMPVSLMLETVEKQSGRARISPSALVAGAAPMGGIEVRFNADFEVELTKMEQVSSVTSVTFEDEEEEAAPRPSVVLRCPEEGDSLWTVAKRYRTTMQDILEANGLDDEGAPLSGKLLLIPGRR